MTNAVEEFKKYMLETFECEYDPTDIDHMTKFAVFEAGWEAAWAVLRR